MSSSFPNIHRSADGGPKAKVPFADKNSHPEENMVWPNRREAYGLVTEKHMNITQCNAALRETDWQAA
jgi:hypothetical protein